MTPKVFFTLVILIVCRGVQCQIIETTIPGGREVLLKPNGTWVYADSPEEIIGGCQDLIVFEETIDGFARSSKGFITSTSHGGVSKIEIFLYRNQHGGSISFTVYGASKCISKGYEITLFCSDKSTTVLKNDKNANCDGEASSIFLNHDPLYEILATKDIERIRVNTMNGYVEESLSPEVANKLNASLRCLFQ